MKKYIQSQRGTSSVMSFILLIQISACVSSTITSSYSDLPANDNFYYIIHSQKPIEIPEDVVISNGILSGNIYEGEFNLAEKKIHVYLSSDSFMNINTDMILSIPLDAHPEDFEELIKLTLTDKQKYSWRAAWLLWSCMEENDIRIQGYVKNIIDTISDRSDDQQRELLILLHKMEINEDLEGLLFDHCVRVWEKTGKKPSLRYNAFRVLVKIAKKHPDLYHEIMLLTHIQYLDSLSSTVRKSISKMIKAFRKKE